MNLSLTARLLNHTDLEELTVFELFVQHVRNVVTVIGSFTIRDEFTNGAQEFVGNSEDFTVQVFLVRVEVGNAQAHQLHLFHLHTLTNLRMSFFAGFNCSFTGFTTSQLVFDFLFQRINTDVRRVFDAHGISTLFEQFKFVHLHFLHSKRGSIHSPCFIGSAITAEQRF